MYFVRRFVFLVLVQALMAGAAFAQAKATPDEAKAFAEKAIAHIKAVGPDKAFADFNSKDGKWQDRELYVIAIAFDGTMLAHATNSKLVGKPQLELRDPNGKFMSREMIEVAKTKGSGWVDYVFPNPVSKKFEQKSTYAIRIPNFDGFVGVGVYK